MMTSPTTLSSLQLVLSCFWLVLMLAPADASLTFKDTAGLVEVDCPATQTTFVALTELVLEGRDKLLSLEERNELKFIYQEVYNNLTQQYCDSLFRRITNLTFVNMTNTLGENEVATAESKAGERQRMLQSQSNTSVSDIPGVDIVYEVTGTCRDCEGEGEFELYDDSYQAALRRALWEQTDGEFSIRFLEPLRILQANTFQQEADGSSNGNGGGGGSEADGADGWVNDDCLCVNGTEPTEPQAPRIDEFVAEFNDELDNVRVEKGLFMDLNMTTVVQLDNPPPAPAPAPANNNNGTTDAATSGSATGTTTTSALVSLLLSLGVLGLTLMNAAFSL